MPKILGHLTETLAVIYDVVNKHPSVNLCDIVKMSIVLCCHAIKSKALLLSNGSAGMFSIVWILVTLKHPHALHQVIFLTT